MLRWVLMGWPGPYSHSRLRAETETSLCSSDREKTKKWAFKSVQKDLWKILTGIHILKEHSERSTRPF